MSTLVMNGAPVFSQRESSFRAVGTRSADFLARRDRVPYSTGVRNGSIIWKTVIEFYGKPVSFVSSGAIEELPSWVLPVFQSLAERWGQTMGWDGYHAKPTNDRHVQTLLNCLSLVVPDKGAAPIVVPLADGGVQAEWHKSDSVLEVVVADDEPPRFFFYDADTQKEEAGAFTPSLAKVRQLIEQF